jgi:hypothetical protein
MIDITKLRGDKRPQSSTVVHALIDRLEAAEKSDAESIAMYRKVRDERDALRAEIEELHALIAAVKKQADAEFCLRVKKEEEYARLRAKIEQMEKQRPIGLRFPSALRKMWASYEIQRWIEEQGPLYALPGAQPSPKAVAYLDLGTGGYMDIGTDLTDEELATLPKGRHMLGVIGTYGVDGYVPVQPTPSVPDGWLRAIDEALVVAHIGVANENDTYEQAKAKLDNLIGFHVDVATDPAVNGGWKLVPVEPEAKP